MGWKMSSAEMAVLLTVAVGPKLEIVAVSTRDRLRVVLGDRLANGCVAGLPEVSSEEGMIFG